VASLVYIIVEGERHIQRKRERIKLMPGRAEAVHRSKDSRRADESVDGVARENHQLKRRPKLTFFLVCFQTNVSSGMKRGRKKRRPYIYKDVEKYLKNKKKKRFSGFYYFCMYLFLSSSFFSLSA
jgi:hypothetical protein